MLKIDSSGINNIDCPCTEPVCLHLLGNIIQSSSLSITLKNSVNFIDTDLLSYLNLGVMFIFTFFLTLSVLPLTMSSMFAM